MFKNLAPLLIVELLQLKFTYRCFLSKNLFENNMTAMIKYDEQQDQQKQLGFIIVK